MSSRSDRSPRTQIRANTKPHITPEPWTRMPCIALWGIRRASALSLSGRLRRRHPLAKAKSRTSRFSGLQSQQYSSRYNPGGLPPGRTIRQLSLSHQGPGLPLATTASAFTIPGRMDRWTWTDSCCAILPERWSIPRPNTRETSSLNRPNSGPWSAGRSLPGPYSGADPPFGDRDDAGGHDGTCLDLPLRGRAQCLVSVGTIHLHLLRSQVKDLLLVFPSGVSALPSPRCLLRVFQEERPTLPGPALEPRRENLEPAPHRFPG